MDERLAFLFEKYYRQTISADEKEELLSLMGEGSNEATLKELIMSTYSDQAMVDTMPSEQSDAILAAIFSTTGVYPTPVHRIHFLRTAWFRYAAAVILVIGIVAYFFSSRHEAVKMVQTTPDAPIKNDKPPGKQGAILTLADGRTVVLDSLKTGVVATQTGTSVILSEGRLTYRPTGTDSVSFNTMTTPHGRQFQLVLPDGSAVWLNAASSITYPTSFTGKERRVSITGEAYLEVSKNPQMPFIVTTLSRQPGGGSSTEIEVLGTHFNVNAYSDEDFVKTTLLEGAVRVRSGINSQELKPGSQSLTSANGELTKINNADINEAVAWKNGFFQFNKASLRDVMRQLSRWYNVEVSYEGNIPDLQFGGKIQQDLNLSEVLEGLEQSQVRFKIEGSRLIAMPASVN